MKEEGFSVQTSEQETQETMAAEGFAGLSSGDSSSGDSSLAGSSLAGNSLERHVLSAADVVLQGGAIEGIAEGIVVLPLPSALSLVAAGAGVRFVRAGDDLVIELGAKTVVVEGYFAASPPPTLTLGSGGQLSPSLVASFLEQGGDFPQKYALGWLQEKLGMADDDGEMPVIGEIVSTEGQVRVVRDGLVMRLEVGDTILEGDIISTGEGAEVFMRFTDKMEFRLGEDARLAIDQYLYDDVSSSGLQALSIIAGAFSYASGLVAGANPDSVRLQTPQGVIGIRGTKILGEVGDGKLVVTVLEGRVALLQDDREVAILDESFETLRVDSAVGGAGVTTQISSVAEVLQTYDLLDGSEQQLRALGAGERLEDEPIEDAGEENEEGNSGSETSTATDAGEAAEVALLSGGDETYILAPVAQEESSFIDAEDGGAVATADLVENLDENLDAGEVEEEIVEEEIVEEEIVVEPAPSSPYLDSSLPAGELSFEGSSVGVTFDFSTTDTSGFNKDREIVFLHGLDVSVLADSEGVFDLAVKGVVDATGGGGSDILTGDSNRNTLAGGEGADILDGGAGDDIIRGGAGDDIVEGGAGLDRYFFQKGDGTDSVKDNGGKIAFEGSSYTDTTTYTFTRPDSSSAAVIFTVRDSGGNTLNTIKFASDPLLGYYFYRLDGGTNTAIDTSKFVVPPLQDGSKSNPFLATADPEILTGSVGKDWVSYEGANGVTVDLGTPVKNVGWAAGDTLNNINNLIGSGHKDVLLGDSGANILRGGADADTLDGGDGDDLLEGGTGRDIYIFESGHGSDIIQGDENDAAGALNSLYFKDARGISDFNFSRAVDGSVIITVKTAGSTDSVTIEAASYANGRYALHYGSSDTKIGNLWVGTRNADEIDTYTTGGNIFASAEGDDTFTSYTGEVNLIGGAGNDDYIIFGTYGPKTIIDKEGSNEVHFQSSNGHGVFETPTFTKTGNDLVVAAGLTGTTLIHMATIKGYYDADNAGSFTIYYNTSEGGTYIEVTIPNSL